MAAQQTIQNLRAFSYGQPMVGRVKLPVLAYEEVWESLWGAPTRGSTTGATLSVAPSSRYGEQGTSSSPNENERPFSFQGAAPGRAPTPCPFAVGMVPLDGGPASPMYSAFGQQMSDQASFFGSSPLGLGQPLCPPHPVPAGGLVSRPRPTTEELAAQERQRVRMLVAAAAKKEEEEQRASSSSGSTSSRLSTEEPGRATTHQEQPPRGSFISRREVVAGSTREQHNIFFSPEPPPSSASSGSSPVESTGEQDDGVSTSYEDGSTKSSSSDEEQDAALVRRYTR